MNLFFSHSKITYNTSIEDKCLAEIKTKYPYYHIINPKYIEITKPINTPEEFKEIIEDFILPIVRNCKILVYYKDDSYSPGVDMEIAEARKRNIHVVKLKIKGWSFENIHKQQKKANHSFNNNKVVTKSNDDSFQKWLNSLPPLPIHNPKHPKGQCEICDGIKVCSNKDCLGKRTMYLDKKRRCWHCIRCQHYEIVIDPFQKGVK